VGENANRRQAERVKVCCKMEIVGPSGRARVESRPALSVDISANGVSANTPHELRPGEDVEVVISTGPASTVLGLPPLLCAHASVCRVEAQAGGWRRIALAFAPAFAQSMEMAMYMAYLVGLQQEGGPGVALA
jgi:hypothetical protein